MFTPPPSPLPARSPSLPMRPPSISINSTYSEDDDSEIPSGAFKSHLNTPTVPTPASKWPTANPLGKKSSRRRIIIPLLAVALVLVAIASRLGSTSREGSPPPGHDRTHGDHVQPDIALEPHRDMHLKPGWRHSLHRAVAEAGALRTLPPHSDPYSHHPNTHPSLRSPQRDCRISSGSNRTSHPKPTVPSPHSVPPTFRHDFLLQLLHLLMSILVRQLPSLKQHLPSMPPSLPPHPRIRILLRRAE